MDAFQQVMTRAARGELRIDVEQVSLVDVENAWQRDSRGRRFVLIHRRRRSPDTALEQPRHVRQAE